jgi:hypothetical protein
VTQFGIDLDDQASNYYSYNNLLMGSGGSGIKIQWNRHNTWINNILVNGSNTTLTGVWSGANHYMTRNIFTSNSPYWCKFFSNIGITNPVLIADTIAKHVKLIDSNVISSSAGGVSTEAGNCSWASWHAAGLDVHSVYTADPMFVNTSQTWPGYLPKGNYQVKAGSPALSIGFKNFAMDSFGVMPAAPVSVQMSYKNNPSTADKSLFKVKYAMGQLAVSHAGNYSVAIMTVQGRTVKAFIGKGLSILDVDAKVLGTGVYFAVIRAQRKIETWKFLIN